jgi:hypothetical protein
MPIKYFKVGQNVLANCGSRRHPDWIPGTVTEVTDSVNYPYRVRLERPSDGKDEWYFPKVSIKSDTPRNRRKERLS